MPAFDEDFPLWGDVKGHYLTRLSDQLLGRRIENAQHEIGFRVTECGELKIVTLSPTTDLSYVHDICDMIVDTVLGYDGNFGIEFTRDLNYANTMLRDTDKHQHAVFQPTGTLR